MEECVSSPQPPNPGARKETLTGWEDALCTGWALERDVPNRNLEAGEKHRQ